MADELQDTDVVEPEKEKVTVPEVGKHLKIKSWDEIENIQIEEEEIFSEKDWEKKTKEEIVEFRFNQTEDSKLAEYITGLRPENPDILERLALDQQRIRVRYGLPSMEWVTQNPSEYERFLRDMAKKNNVQIRDKSDCGKFFDENIVGAVYLHRTKTAGVDIDRSDLGNYFKTLAQLEHELIHSIQAVRYPSIPVEIAEYEAYVAHCNVDYLRERPEDLGWIFFGFFVGGSVNWWYRHMNEEERKNMGGSINPKWRNPEFFLRKVDKFTEEEIEKYRKGLVTLNDS